MTDQASRTAEYMALFRALESSRRAGSRLFYDPHAALFLNGGRKWLYRIGRIGLGRRIVERLLDGSAPGARAAGTARTKWIDDEATAALESATQLVLLGAGFDTRAYRLPQAALAAVFELDRPETSLVKRAALKQAFGSLPPNVRFVTIDFNRQPVGEVLTAAGFDTKQGACFIWEGVTNYLATEAVGSTLDEIRRVTSEGILLFTYVDRLVLDHPDRFYGAVKLLARLKSYGEPWTFGLDPAEAAEYLAPRGFRLVKDVSVAEVWQQAGRPAQEIHGYEFYRVASARLE
jgi:methyltransferase (TIGR00027 family)